MIVALKDRMGFLNAELVINVVQNSKFRVIVDVGVLVTPAEANVPPSLSAKP